MIEIKMARCTLILAEKELLGLLAKDPELWAEALRRDKAVRRARAAEGREVKIKGGYHGTLHHAE